MSEAWHELDAHIAAVDTRLSARRLRMGLQARRLGHQVARRATSWEVLFLGATAGYIAGELSKRNRRAQLPARASGAEGGRWQRTIDIAREIFRSPLGKMLLPVAIQQVHALLARRTQAHEGAPGMQEK